MKINRPPKWKVLLIALVFSGAFVLAQARTAHACLDPITFPVCAGAAVVVTYAAVKATVCTPVAAVKAWDHAAGFGGAFKDCWDWSLISKQPGSTGAVASEQPAREAE